MEFLSEFLVKYWLEVIFTFFLGGVSVAGKYIWSTIKRDYLDSVKQNRKELQELKDSVNSKFDSIDNKMEQLYSQSKSSDLVIIRDTLLRKMRHGLQCDTCITLADVETVAALMAQYEELGGNGEIHKLYKRYEKLNICPEYDFHHYESDGYDTYSDK